MYNKDEYFEVKILTEQDFTDKRIVSFMESHLQFTFEEYYNFINLITVESENSNSIIKFLLSYENGSLCPEKCNAYEPINDTFDLNNIGKPIKWLSQPGSAFYFKRNKTNCKYEGSIENHRFSPIWTDKKATKLLVTETPLPLILGEIKFWFNKKDLIKNDKNISFLEQLIIDIDKIIKVNKYFILK